jgi:hypothetical protein
MSIDFRPERGKVDKFNRIVQKQFFYRFTFVTALAARWTSVDNYYRRRTFYIEKIIDESRTNTERVRGRITPNEVVLAYKLQTLNMNKEASKLHKIK